MAASQRVQILNDKISELSLLAEYIRNPNLISDLADEIKKLNFLTKEEEDKAAEGRSLVEKRDVILKEFEDKHSKLALAQEDHDKRAAELDSKATNLGENQAELDRKNAARLETEKYLSESKRQLEVDRDAMEKKLEEDRAALSIQAEKISSDRIRNEKEAQRLSDLDKALKEKTAVLKGILGN